MGNTKNYPHKFNLFHAYATVVQNNVSSQRHGCKFVGDNVDSRLTLVSLELVTWQLQ